MPLFREYELLNEYFTFGFMHGTAIGLDRTSAVAARFASRSPWFSTPALQYGPAMMLEPEHEGAGEEKISIAQLKAQGASLKLNRRSLEL
jgi:hypothetical protein